VAQNVFLSMIYLGNYADIDTNEGNLATENESSLFGTYGSTSNPLHTHVVSVETDSPTQFIDANHDTGNGDLIYDVGSGSVTVGLDSFVTFYGTVTYADGSSENIAIDILQMTNGDLFMPAWDSYTQFGTKPVESISLNSVEYDRWGGLEQSSYDSVQFVCFANGTQICTSGGEAPVESLGVGDLVVTRDHGLQPIQWLRHDLQPLQDVCEHERPVLIRTGALGPGIPSEDLIVSPNHRILVGGSRQLQDLFRTEAFAPAKSLTSLRGIRHMKGKRHITWVHFACDRHEVVTANGCLSESLLLGPMVQNGLTAMQRRALTEIFGEATSPDGSLNGPAARDCLRVGEVRRSLKENSQLSAQTTKAA
jgi:hypothetical protein